MLDWCKISNELLITNWFFPGHGRKDRRESKGGGAKDKGSTWLLLRSHKDHSSNDGADEEGSGRSRSGEILERRRSANAANSKRGSEEREGNRRSRELHDDDKDEDHVKREKEHRSKLKTSSLERDDDKVQY